MTKPLKEDYPITQYFDTWSLWYPQWNFLHCGIDWATPVGTSVYAVRDGQVVSVGSGYNAGWGNNIVINHSDEISMYNHLSIKYVVAGQFVKEGQRIGLTGNTGFSSGPHLDFRIKKDGNWIDPMPLFVEDWLTNFLTENNMTLPELLETLKKDFVSKDQRFNFDDKTGEIWICNNNKRYKLGTDKNDIAILGAKMCGEHLSDAERKYPITENRSDVL
ncbi:M23 family metallopeptidase [Candidatus Dojkabacteria bacterium]|jgi:hypothetical protein|nr:M23 family metallopeptidase [Candidatus Dojkabacteria bacterium]